MARYVDGFLIPIPKKNLATYKRIARACGKIWREYGALEYVECVSDHMALPGPASFEKRTKLKQGEAVLFSWIVYRSRAHRDRVNAKVMQDPRMLKMCEKMKQKGASPFDIKRLSFAGFRTLVQL